jgi:hypothetical protein
MPRLLGLRMESIGHRDARFDGLTLSFTGADGEPCDSVIWLRNGGGKSSILNLLFSLLRPHQREFLGSEAEARVRELDDYLAEDDTGSVCLAWRLDSEEPGAPLLLTGVCMERSRSADGGRLRRLFYAIRTDDPAATPVTLESLPLVVGENGRRRVARLAGIREFLRGLAELPGVRVLHTETQREWEEALESYGLDPEVFGYQVQMNRREGAADELFRFASEEEFVDFLLKMAFHDGEASQVQRNLREHRAQVERRPRLVREREVLELLTASLRPLAALAEEREQRRAVLAERRAAATRLRARLAGAAAGCVRRAAVAEDDRQREDRRYGESSRLRNRRQWALVAYRKRAAQLEAESRARALAKAQEEVARREHQISVCRAARVLANLRELESKATALNRELERRLVEHRPLRETLSEAAAALRDALDAELHALEAREQLLGSRRAEIEAREERTRERQRAAEVRHGTLETEIRHARRRLERLEERRGGLEAEGALLAEEPAARAAARLASAVEALHGDAREELAAVEIEDAEAGRCLERAGAAGREAGVAEEAAGTHARELAEARRELGSLEADPVLAAALEDSRPDLLALGTGACGAMARRAQLVTDALIRLRIEEEQGARELRALERDELLPPSLDTELVQRRLREVGITAYAGGAYLAENARGPRAEELVHAHPELVAGVVVAEADLAGAGLELAGRPPEVLGPVVVGTTAELLGSGVARIVAMPPRAVFDRAAGVGERERRETASARRRANLESMTQERQALAALQARLDRFLERHGATWFAEHGSREQALRAGAAERLAEEARLRTEAARLRARVDERRQRARERTEDAQLAALRREAVQRFLDDDGGRLPELRAELDGLCAEAAAAAADGRAAVAELPSMAEERRRLEADAVELGARQQGLRAEQSRPAELAGGLPRAAVVPPLGEARERFDTRLREYERATTREELSGRIREVGVQIERQRGELGRTLRAGGCASAEAEALLGEAEGIGIEEHQRRLELGLARAHDAVGSAREEHAVARRSAQEAEANAEEVRRQGHGREVVEQLSAVAELGAATLAERIALTEREVAELRATESEADRLRQEAQVRVQEATSTGDALSGLARRLGDVLDLPSAAETAAADGDGDDPELDASAERARVDRLIPELRGLEEEVRALDRQAQDAARELAAFATRPEHDVLPATLRARLCEAELELLLARAGDHLQDVELRIAALSGELDQVESFRKLLATALQRATDPALRLLRGLERASRFPEGEAVWGGEPFIKVELRLPPSAAEREAVAATLIDRLVQAGSDIPGGLRLVQLFVRELTRGGGLSVKIVKPEVFRRLCYEPVDRLRAFSRGEQLTAAILLYCTLAQLRAQERGKRRSPTSVLILDNPLGTCSRPEFVELQRAMARAHRVQLIYTTGIEDLEALGRLPVVLRLRNAHQDTRGRMHVTSEPAPPVQVARIARRE